MQKTPTKGTRKPLLLMYGFVGGLLMMLLAACGAQAASGLDPQASSSVALAATSQISRGTVIASFSGHTDPVLSTAWSPDGTRVVSTSMDSTVQAWDARNGKLLWKREFAGARHVAWSPDGQSVAVGTMVQGGDNGAGLVYILKASDGSNQFISQKYDHGINGLCWSPDSSAVAYSVENGIVEILDLKNNGNDNKTYRLAATDTVGAVAWSPNGKYLAWAITTPGTPVVQVINIATGASAIDYKGHSDLINSLAWSPDSQRLASASNDKTVRVWNTSTGATLRTYSGHTGAVISVSWSPDGKYLASGSADKTVQVFNATTGSKTFTFKKHTETVFTVSWSPDSKRIASAGVDLVVRVWQAV